MWTSWNSSAGDNSRTEIIFYFILNLIGADRLRKEIGQITKLTRNRSLELKHIC